VSDRLMAVSVYRHLAANSLIRSITVADFTFKELRHSYSWIANAMMSDPAATATYCLPSNM
jgi:hypothetical protein